jgi:hypothetical protein
MSSNICRETYINYGSYLRSRGYDKQICQLVTDLDNGLLPVGGFTFNGANSATFTGPITINSYSSNDGKLLVTGGANNNISNFSISGLNGLFINGSFVQTTPNTTYSGDDIYSSGNVFRSRFHNFTNTATDVSCSVIIDGSMTVGNDLAITNGVIQTPDRSKDALTIDNDGVVTLTGPETVTSDDLLKHNETTITNGLNVVNQMNPVTYDKSFTIDNSDNLILNSGYIAQEIYAINDLSHNIIVGGYKPDGTYKPWSLNYDGLMPFHTSAIKELYNNYTNLNNQVITQTTTITQLQSEITALKTRIGALE